MSVKDRALNIIKGAILLEQRGKTFYQKIADQTKIAAVKEIFQMMAAEEEHHIQILKRHFESILTSGKFDSVEYDTAASVKISESILTEKIQAQIAVAGYEAAAISAAIAMEEKAVAFYSDQASSAKDPEEQKLFEWLANWEKGHLKLLADIDKELLESVWYDNQFWPEL